MIFPLDLYSKKMLPKAERFLTVGVFIKSISRGDPLVANCVSTYFCLFSVQTLTGQLFLHTDIYLQETCRDFIVLNPNSRFRELGELQTHTTACTSLPQKARPAGNACGPRYSFCPQHLHQLWCIFSFCLQKQYLSLPFSCRQNSCKLEKSH